MFGGGKKTQMRPMTTRPEFHPINPNNQTIEQSNNPNNRTIKQSEQSEQSNNQTIRTIRTIEQSN
ncbi:MAG: hypothetical protein MJ249_14575, partial [Kiritimatiellae bacterium]|nr:hypothetical protein [Kiritimatiellia bacterium]